MDSRNEEGIASLQSILSNTEVIHIYGAGLNSERPAHTAVGELRDRGWAVAPLHPRDAGATINGFPIRLELEDGIVPEVVVLFLAPERARAVVRNLIIRFEREEFPLVWFQIGAEDEQSRQALLEMDVPFVEHDCLDRLNGLCCLFWSVHYNGSVTALTRTVGGFILETAPHFPELSC